MLPSLFTASLVVTAVAAPLVTSYVVNPTTGSRCVCGCGATPEYQPKLNQTKLNWRSIVRGGSCSGGWASGRGGRERGYGNWGLRNPNLKCSGTPRSPNALRQTA